jgi:hypothetical protein
MQSNLQGLSAVIRKLRNKFLLSNPPPIQPASSSAIAVQSASADASTAEGRVDLATEMEELVTILTRTFDSTDAATLSAADATTIENLADRLHVSINDLCRKAKAAHAVPPSAAQSFDGRERLGIHIMRQTPPWRDLTNRVAETPGMITSEEASYYAWLTRFYTGQGRVVELGPWLGSSTIAIQTGLKRNPRFGNEKLQVFDDFIWRKSWMDPYVAEADRLPNHANFRHLFDRYTSSIADDLAVHQSRFAVYDGNDAVTPLQWNQGNIEMIFVDCGRTIEANDGWYNTLSRYFIPGVTLVVMQDWRLHRELPRKWFNQTALFTESKESQLQLIHEVSDGGIATFLYNGRSQ